MQLCLHLLFKLLVEGTLHFNRDRHDVLRGIRAFDCGFDQNVRFLAFADFWFSIENNAPLPNQLIKATAQDISQYEWQCWRSKNERAHEHNAALEEQFKEVHKRYLERCLLANESIRKLEEDLLDAEFKLAVAAGKSAILIDDQELSEVKLLGIEDEPEEIIAAELGLPMPVPEADSLLSKA